MFNSFGLYVSFIFSINSLGSFRGIWFDPKMLMSRKSVARSLAGRGYFLLFGLMFIPYVMLGCPNAFSSSVVFHA